jgi:hypothetical protein
MLSLLITAKSKNTKSDLIPILQDTTARVLYKMTVCLRHIEGKIQNYVRCDPECTQRMYLECTRWSVLEATGRILEAAGRSTSVRKDPVILKKVSLLFGCRSVRPQI